MELETNKILNYLDVSIQRHNDNLELNIYRKLTFTGTIIPFNSCHLNEHRFAAIRFLINRLNTYQWKTACQKKEMIYIQNILYNNFFPLQLINNVQGKDKNTKPLLKK
jgi:hypothetical protein